MTVMIITAIAGVITGIIGGYRATVRVLTTMAEDDIGKVKLDLVVGGVFLLLIIFVGLAVMLYVQNVVRKKQIDFNVFYSQIQHRYVWCDRKNLNRVLISEEKGIRE